MSQENVELVRRAFVALDAGDPYVFLDMYDPEIELVVSGWGGFGLEGGIVRGSQAVNRWYGHLFAQLG